MKSSIWFLSCGLGLAATCLDLQAEAGAAPALPKTRTRVQKLLTDLIKEDAGAPTIANPVAASQPEASSAPAETAENTLVLDPMVVTAKKSLEIPPPLHETRVQEFFRTGTIWKKVGPRFTREFWFRGDQGIGFTLSW